jgi:hypothetical protein
MKQVFYFIEFYGRKEIKSFTSINPKSFFLVFPSEKEPYDINFI